MKKPIAILSVLVALGTFSTYAEPAEPARSTSQVTLRVNAKTIRPEKVKKQDDEKKEDDKPASETVTKSLDVAVSAANSIKGPLKLVTRWYGRDLATKKPAMAKTEEAEVALDASKTAKVTVPPFAFTSTPAHSRKGADGKQEKVAASGQNFYGWVVRAYEGTTLVGEVASSPPLLKLRD